MGAIFSVIVALAWYKLRQLYRSGWKRSNASRRPHIGNPVREARLDQLLEEWARPAEGFPPSLRQRTPTRRFPAAAAPQRDSGMNVMHAAAPELSGATSSQHLPNSPAAQLGGAQAGPPAPRPAPAVVTVLSDLGLPGSPVRPSTLRFTNESFL